MTSAIAAPRAAYALLGTSRGPGLAALACLTAVACVAVAFVGTAPLRSADVVGALTHPLTPGLAHDVVWNIRAPRIALAAGVGIGLGMAGAILQAVFRNPLVDPYVTGVSAGAALAATAAFVAGAAFAFVPPIAFAGGVACGALVVAIGASGAGGASRSNLRVVLAGVAMSALCGAGVTLLLLRVGDAGGLSIISWLAGSVTGHSWSDVAWFAAYLFAGALAAAMLVHKLNVLRIGGWSAVGLGSRAAAARWQSLAVAAALTAGCVAVSGIVSFVGLIVPHGVRRLFGGDMRWMLPGSAICGALVVVIADALARVLMPPTELPLGVLLAVVGVPFFLTIARRPVEL